MPETTLVSTAWLEARLTDGTVVIVDCRFSLDDPEWGRSEYESKHIPGAVYAGLDQDLSGPKSGTNGRHPLPNPDTLARAFGRLGIGDGIQVVAYDQDSGMYASRLWWMLRWLGHDAVAVLDGGLSRWMEEGRPTTSGQRPHATREFSARPREGWAVTVDEVAKLSSDASWRLVDARSPERFRGESETIDRVAGHIPGATNHFFRTNLNEHGTFRSPDELRAQFAKTLGDTAPDRVICYCGSGVTACHNLLALDHAGIRGARLYAGSWSEWSSDASRPVETAAKRA